jgi:hypothetical protein
MWNAMRALLFVVCALAIAIASPACDKYVSPPVAALDGIHDGLLDDPAQPIVIDFTHPVDPSTLTVKVVLFQPDSNGLLADEHGDPTVDLHPFFAHDPIDGDGGGTSTLSPDGRSLSIMLPARLPVGPKLAVLIEPGLASTTGEATAVRKRLLFTYDIVCSGSAASTFASGVYFFLLDVEQPVGTQIKLYSDIVVDPKTGIFQAQFTLARRVLDPTRCTPACAAGNVCQTIPSSMCVVPSTRAGSTDEFPDFFADPAPPIGFTLTATGCVIDQPGGLVAFTTAPADLVVQQPSVAVDGLVIIASFSPDANGVMRATGGITGDNSLLGKAPLGSGHGTVAARFVPADKAPMVPAPPPAATH